MNPGRSLLVPAIRLGLAAILLLAAGCAGYPDLDAGSDPLIVTETGTGRAEGDISAERSAAVAEMRAKAEAAETGRYPDVFRSEQTARLAAREEPRSVDDAEAIQSELAALAERRSVAAAPGEIAAMERRAAELRRLAVRARNATEAR